ncbi:MAG TPA: hypothetical protein VJN64_07865 [Terriglobales bacterium]|nr:hypothetical protein [Terriglobales bacterium]
MHREGHLDDAYWALRLSLGSSAFLAGLDKFTNLLTNWEKYLAPQVRERLPVSGRKFMYGVGIIEMLVGVGILTAKPKLASYTASAWLLSIAAELALNGDYDIAVRDVNMAIAAYALARSEGERQNRTGESEFGEDAGLERVA